MGVRGVSPVTTGTSSALLTRPVPRFVAVLRTCSLDTATAVKDISFDCMRSGSPERLLLALRFPDRRFPMQLRLSAPLVALAVMAALPGVAQAQGRDVYKLPMPTQASMGASMGRAQPGVAASSPIGFGPGRNQAFAGFGYQNTIATGNNSDGAATVGVGLLSGSEIVGVELTVTALSTVRSGFGSRMVGGMKLHKTFGRTGIGLGMEGVRLAGDEFDTRQSVYLAATQVHTLRDASTFNQVVINGGVGSGRFQSHEAFVDDERGVGFFGSAALRVNEYSSAILDFTGAQLNAALSFSPFASMPVVVTPSINDVTGAAGQAGRLALAAGFSWKF